MAAAQHAYDTKLQYWESVRDVARDVPPLAVELWGAWHPYSANVVRRIAALSAHATSSDVGPTVDRLWQRLSVLITWHMSARPALHPRY